MTAPLMEAVLDQPLRGLLPAIQARCLSRTTYAGVQAMKCPLDAWVYQEIVFERRPELVLEVGNGRGGSLLMYAHWLDAIGAGRVVGVDLVHRRVPAAVRNHPRITLLTGDAVALASQAAALAPPGAEVLVVEDSSHEYCNTLAVLRAYAGLVRPGGYFIVEDTICGHGLATGPRPGAYEAVQAFLAEAGSTWEADRARESFGLTWNPGGYLRRVK